MRLKQYINMDEGKKEVLIAKAKKEIEELRLFKRKGKLTKQGESRLAKLEDALIRMGIWDF